MKRPKQRRRLSGPRKPRRRKTFEELTALNDDELRLDTDTGIVLKLEDKDELPEISYADLLEKFYKRNYRLSPIVMKLQSDFQGPIIEKVWWIIMYANFFIDVSKGSELGGPHRCRLWFRTFRQPVENHWIATVQLTAFFFNEEEIRRVTKEAVATKAFYMAPVNANIMVKP